MRKKMEIRRRQKHLPGLDHYAELIVKAALAEDIGAGDITTRAIVKRADTGTAHFIAKEEMVVAGLIVLDKVFNRLDKKIVIKAHASDGDAVKKGSVIAEVTGRLDAILVGERVALNFMQRLSGIATLTREYVRRVGKTGAKILDTRKTTPCMRILEKYAVRVGGGRSHRFGLFDSILIKDNHIKAAGSVGEALRRVNGKYMHRMPVEVEVRNIAEVRQALKERPDIIMLDNMPTVKIKEALKMIDNKALVEVSGGVSLSNVAGIAKTGVDFISVGALTHSARGVDISMKVVSLCGARKTRRPK